MTLLRTLREDLAAARGHDPAARSDVENAIVYSGLHAIWAHRLAHRMWGHTRVARSGPGSRAVHPLPHRYRDPPPRATIGRRFFIDHGMGVVIGETAEIGDDVMLYHGVTLGGRSMAKAKRHPHDRQPRHDRRRRKVLGPITIGDDSAVGANAVVTRDVPPDSIAAGIPATVRSRTQKQHEPLVDPTTYIDPAMYI